MNVYVDEIAEEAIENGEVEFENWEYEDLAKGVKILKELVENHYGEDKKVKICPSCSGEGRFQTHDCWGKTEYVDCDRCDGKGYLERL